jgi:YggT family protein
MLALAVYYLVRLFELVIIVHVLLSYFLPPYHKFRVTLNRFVEPLLAPIRRLVPSVGMFDLSPLILLIVVQLLGQLLVSLLQSLGL